MILGDYEFNNGDEIKIGKYTFVIRRGDLWLQRITPLGNLAYVDFEPEILLMLLENLTTWSITHK